MSATPDPENGTSAATEDLEASCSLTDDELWGEFEAAKWKDRAAQLAEHGSISLTTFSAAGLRAVADAAAQRARDNVEAELASLKAAITAARGLIPETNPELLEHGYSIDAAELLSALTGRNRP